MEYKTITNLNGYIIDSCISFIDGQPQNFILEEGQQVVERYDNKKQIFNSREVEYLKPKWNGTEWIETATQEELNSAYPIIEVKIDEQEILNAKLLMENAEIKTELQEQQELNAQLLLDIATLKGGSTSV